MSYEPRSLNPNIMEKRINDLSKASGTGAIPIASAETLGGIKVPADSGMSVDADGAISGVPYSTTEHKTGRKWIDGKDIYEKTIELAITSLEDSSTIIATNIDYVDVLVDSNFNVQKSNVKGCERGCAYISANNELKLHVIERWTDIAASQITILYTKNNIK